MNVCGVEITLSRKKWLMAVVLHVELQIGRDLTDKETDLVLLEAVKRLAEAEKERTEPGNDPMNLSWPEVYCYAALIAAYFNRTGHDPSDDECKAMVPVAREMAVAPSSTVQ